MNDPLKDKIVMISGADSGLGLAFASRFVSRGSKLILLVERDRFQALERVIAEREWNLSAHVIVVDFEKPESFSETSSRAHSVHGAIDVLVNNAGVRVKKRFFDISNSDWDKSVDVNMRIPFFLTQSVARKMVESSRPGSIINIASHLGFVAAYDHSVYGITKGGMVAMTRVLALELARFGIVVNGVAPGPTNTAAAGLLKDDVEVVDFLHRMPIARRIEPVEVAQAVEYLATLGGGAMTGHTLIIDGGWTVL